MKQAKQHKGSHRVAANRHRHVHKSVVVLMAALLVIVIIASMLLIAGYISNRRQIYLSQSGVDIRVYSIKYDDVGTYPFTPPKSSKFVIVRLSVSNNSSRDFNFAPVLQTYLTDRAGHQYQMSPATLTDPIDAGLIAPKQSRTGSLSYLVPINAKNLTLQFKL